MKFDTTSLQCYLKDDKFGDEKYKNIIIKDGEV